jgi:glutamate dehydrogenase (NADP+)
MHQATETIVNRVIQQDPHQPEFHQAVVTFMRSIDKVVDDMPEIVYHKILDRIVEPERVVMFRVPWIDDDGVLQLNRGYRIQMNSALGPYKGGLRFHPSVNLSILKFLAFEQTFKNSLTGLPMGGAKGGSDFNPKGKSEGEVMRFCQSFMSELYRHIGPDTDVPAGDIGVGGREVGYLFGEYKRLTNTFSGVLTGKGKSFGGSNIRPEATGYGLVYIADAVLEGEGMSLKGKRCLVSGSGNVAQFTTEKLLQMGAKVLTLSDSSGVMIDPEGFDEEKLAFVKTLKNVKRGRIKEYAEKYPKCTYIPHDGNATSNPLWDVPADYAFPAATQNEINKEDAQHLAKNGVKMVAEGANMPSTIEAQQVYREAGMLHIPSKAAKRRWRRRFRTGDEPEQRTALLEPGRG